MRSMGKAIWVKKTAKQWKGNSLFFCFAANYSFHRVRFLGAERG